MVKWNRINLRAFLHCVHHWPELFGAASAGEALALDLVHGLREVGPAGRTVGKESQPHCRGVEEQTASSGPKFC